MKLEGSIEEFRQLFKMFGLERKELEVKIDGEKVGKLIAPSISKSLNN